jgi:hypothetical protein
MISWLSALVLTVGVEGLIAAAILRRFCWIETAVIQLTTWPIAVLAVARLQHLWLVELGVAVVETGLWMVVLPLRLRTAVTLSVVANLTTTLLGLLLFGR